MKEQLEQLQADPTKPVRITGVSKHAVIGALRRRRLPHSIMSHDGDVWVVDEHTVNEINHATYVARDRILKGLSDDD